MRRRQRPLLVGHAYVCSTLGTALQATREPTWTPRAYARISVRLRAPDVSAAAPLPSLPAGATLINALKANAAHSRLQRLHLSQDLGVPDGDTAAAALGAALRAQGTCGRTEPGLRHVELLSFMLTPKGATPLAKGIRAAGPWLELLDVRTPMYTFQGEPQEDIVDVLRAAASAWLEAGGSGGSGATAAAAPASESKQQPSAPCRVAQHQGGRGRRSAIKLLL